MIALNINVRKNFVALVMLLDYIIILLKVLTYRRASK
jgi:hypothetical protein